MSLSWFDCRKLGILPEDYPYQTPLTAHVVKIKLSPAGCGIGTRRPSIEDIDATKSQLLDEYADVFDHTGPLRRMIGPPMEIDLKEDAIPFSLHCARPVTFAQRDEVKATLDKMVDDGVITPVTGSTDWTHPMVVVEKSNGKPRIFVDLTRLKKFVKRPTYPTRTPIYAVCCSFSG